MSSPETINQSPEKERRATEAVEQAGAERRKELEKYHEKTEKNHENVDDARREVEKVTVELEKKPEETREVAPIEQRKDGPISKAKRNTSFDTTMREVRSQMSGPSRAFSKIIHNKAVDAISEAAGNTVARPNAILSGAVFAFVLTLAVYLVAKNFGYPLSGFETIGAFALGWIIGLVYDFLKVMITGRK